MHALHTGFVFFCVCSFSATFALTSKRTMDTHTNRERERTLTVYWVVRFFVSISAKRGVFTSDSLTNSNHPTKTRQTTTNDQRPSDRTDRTNTSREYHSIEYQFYLYHHIDIYIYIYTIKQVPKSQ